MAVITLTSPPEGGRTLVQSPDAQRVGDVTVIGYEEGSVGYVSVARVHHDDLSVDIVRVGDAALHLDDHDSPAIFLRANGDLIAAWSHHDSSAWAAVSDDAGETWTRYTIASGIGITLTYARLFEVDGVLHLYYRDGDADAGDTVEYTSTDGQTWSGPTVVLDGQTYVVMHHDARLDITTRTNPWAGASWPVRHAYREDDGSWHKSDGTSISLPLTGSDLTEVYNVAGRRTIVYDVREDLILFLSGTNATLPALNDRRWHIASWNGSSWDVEEIATLGDGSIVYTGGAIVSSTEVWVALPVSGTYHVHRYTKAGTWSGQQITSGGTHNFRPIVPRNAHVALPVFWDYGTWTDSDDYSIGIAGFIPDGAVPLPPGAEVGIPDTFTVTAGAPSILSFAIGGAEVGIPSGFRVSATGPAQVLLNVPAHDRPQMTEGGSEGYRLTYHPSRKPTWEEDVGGTPATTVESETTFGLSPAVGTDTEYARQDHTHGTPPGSAIVDLGVRGELLIASEPAGSPLVFTDILQDSEGTALLYAAL